MGDHINIQQCILNNNGLGIFGAGQADFERLMTNITLDGNSIYGNGIIDGEGEHGTYLEGIDTTYEYNYYGPMRASAWGNALKDRGVGTIVEYNYIDGGAHQLDLVNTDNEESLGLTLPEYRQEYVFGNVLVSPVGDASAPVYYGNDDGISVQDQQGILYFYNNTIIIQSNKSEAYKLDAIETSDPANTLDIRNNIIAEIPDNSGSPTSDLGLIGYNDDAYFGANLIIAENYFMTIGGGYNLAGYAGGQNNLIIGSVSSLGFVDPTNNDFRLITGSLAIDAESRLAGSTAAYPVNEEYVNPQSWQARAVVGSAADLGAFEYGTFTPTITSGSPSTGPLVGGTTVTITGTNLDEATSVNFGSTPGTIVSDSPTQLVVTAPAEPAGTVDITVSSPNGTSSDVAADKFTYGNNVISSFSVTGPSSVTAGTSFSETVTALYPDGTVDTGYTGTVTFTSSDGNAGLPQNYTFTASDNGVHTFSVTLKTAGSKTVTATDRSNSAVTGSNSESVSPGAVSSLNVSGPSSATAGKSFNETVEALDAYGNVATGYTDTVAFTSTDDQSGLPSNYTFTASDAGSHTFTITLKTIGSQTVTATDTANSSLHASLSVTVSNGTASSIQISGPSTAIAGTSFTETVTAYDASGNVATGYTGTVAFTSTDTQAGLPSHYTFTASDAGSHTFTITLKTAGSKTDTATDTSNRSLHSSLSVSVAAGAASSYQVSGPSSATAGTSFSETVKVFDAYGNAATGYTGTVAFTSTDNQAGLPSNYTFITSDAGSHTFTITMKTAGSQTDTAADTSNSSLHANLSVKVNPSAASSLSVSGHSTAIAGTSFSETVKVLDAYGNVTTGYTGTVTFTSSDNQAGLPSNYTYTVGDAGSHAFTITLNTAGNQTVTTSDVSNSSITGSASVSVAPSVASRIEISGPATQNAGTSQTFTVKILNANGTVDQGYTGTIDFTSSDPHANLPSNYTFTSANSGVQTFTIAMKTAGTQTVTATDINTSSITGSDSINVIPGSAVQLSLSGTTTATAGYSFAETVTALDSYGNVATGYRGTVSFTTGPRSAILPAKYSFTSANAGVRTFTITLDKAGDETVTATDTRNSSITGSASVSVLPGSLHSVVISDPPAQTAGTSFTETVSALDVYGNVVTDYRGAVHFTSSDKAANLPANYNFTASDNGSHTFTVTLKTVGTQTVVANDTGNSGLHSTMTIVVVPSTASILRFASDPAVSAGTSFNETLIAYDAYGNVATGYTGTVHFTSSDANAVLPANYTFNASNKGEHTFTIEMKTVGPNTVTAVDTTTGSIVGSDAISVLPGVPSKLVLSGLTTATAGTSFKETVTAFDAYGNVATNYRGTVHFTTNSALAALPTNYQFTAADAGVHTFTITLDTAGTEKLAATNMATTSINGTASVQVSPTAAKTFRIAGTATVTAGTSFNDIVTAYDAYGNVATGYTGTVYLTSSDGSAVLPSNYTYISSYGGRHTFTVTLKTAGTQSITATDTSSSTIAGKASSSVTAGAFDGFVVSGIPATVTVGTKETFQVKAVDAYGNTEKGYTGTVKFTSSDPKAKLPANSALINGIGLYSMVFETAGTQSLTATDTKTDLSGEELDITVIPVG